MSDPASPKKVRLRRVKPRLDVTNEIDEDIIKRNLEPLKENIMKKKIAQEAYYNNNENKLGVSPMIRGRFKAPVKARLGIMSLGTNTSTIPPKIRLKRLTNNRNQLGFRTNIAQERLNSIRTRNNLSTSTPITKVRLRRVKANAPTNLKVEVKNNGALLKPNHYRRFKQILNHHLQRQIQELQQQAPPRQTYVVGRVTPVATAVKMTERFAKLS